MKKNKFQNNNDVFLAKWLTEDITDADFKKLVSKEDFLAYNKLKKGILLYEKLEAPLEDSFQKIQSKIDNKNKSKVRNLYKKWSISIAACLLLFIGFQNFFGNITHINKTNFGEQKTIALLDGSEVILQAKSEIKYSKKDWKNNRELYLNGEAFFKVKKGSKFTVRTKNGSVEVLGTQFNVNSNLDFFQVTCYAGKVKVNTKDSDHILTPTKGIRKINNFAAKNLVQQEKAPTWLNGDNRYRSVPLKYVILDLEKQFNLKFNASNIDASVRFTGSFNHKNKQLALATVFKAMRVDYKVTNKNNIILTKKNRL